MFRASRRRTRIAIHAELDRILRSADEIERRITELGEVISADLDRIGPAEGIVLVPVMTGAIIFVADLVRHLPQKIRIKLVTVTSYPGPSTTSQGASIIGARPEDLTGRHVLVVADILDSGCTVRLLREARSGRNPASLRVCVLLRKERPEAMATSCEYVGFDIPDEFVVGYGLDYDDLYRNLPYVGTLRAEAQ